MIDPQAQAIKWIKNMEMANNLRVIDLQTPDYLRIVEECIRTGRPCLCQNVKEELDPSLDPVLTRAVKRIGGIDIMKLGEREVEYNKNFRFYLTTKLPNPHYAPEVSSKANIINFAVKEQGLESQLLGIVVREEKPELEADKDKLVRGIATGRKRLIELEDQLLRLLNETKGSLLENDELLSTLETSKQTAKTVQEQLITSEATEKDIDAAREVRGSDGRQQRRCLALELPTVCRTSVDSILRSERLGQDRSHVSVLSRRLHRSLQYIDQEESEVHEVRRASQSLERLSHLRRIQVMDRPTCVEGYVSLFANL